MKNSELYKKYSHIVEGSIDDIPRGHIVVCGKGDKIKSHGKVCIIKCIYASDHPKCLKTRIINIQDAIQVTMCKICTKRLRNSRRRKRRKSPNN